MVFRIENRGDRGLLVAVRQPWPASLDFEADTLEVRVEPGEVVRAALSVTPSRRGRVNVAPAEIDAWFPQGLARRRWDLPEQARISVYPNLEMLAQYETLRRSHALRQLGIHRMRMIGAGREFDQLREYVPDDDYGDINWKATARHRRPITNVYQAERSQDVLICLDCGRMMGNPVLAARQAQPPSPADDRARRGVPLTALDKAIDAAMMLAHVCNRQGDRVGLVLFREAVHRFLKPANGAAAMTRLLQELIDTQPEGVFPSYAALASAIRVNHKRRSLIFVFTDLNDPQLAANLAEVMPLLSARHVVAVVSLRDPLLDRVAEGPAPDRRALYQALAARELANERQAHARELAKANVQVLEADADSLTLEVVNRYLSIKTRQLI
jgi:uncharacterized protein (DUF58 family)